MSSQYDAALETVLTAARQFAEVIADDEGKSQEDAQVEREIWDALEVFGAARIDPFVAGEQIEPVDPDAEHGAAPVHEIEHVTSALADLQSYLVVGIYHDTPAVERFAQRFDAENPQHAEEQARDAAPGLIVAGVIDAKGEVVS